MCPKSRFHLQITSRFVAEWTQSYSVKLIYKKARFHNRFVPLIPVIVSNWIAEVEQFPVKLLKSIFESNRNMSKLCLAHSRSKAIQDGKTIYSSVNAITTVLNYIEGQRSTESVEKHKSKEAEPVLSQVALSRLKNLLKTGKLEHTEVVS